MYKKNCSGPGSKSTHSGHSTQKSHPPPPKKSGTGYEVVGSKSKNPGGGVILSPKMMILQGVGHLISPTGVCYVNDPKTGQCTPPGPALDLTRSLQGYLKRGGLQGVIGAWGYNSPVGEKLNGIAQ